MINNIKKKKIDDSQEFENENQTSITKSIKKTSKKKRKDNRTQTENFEKT